MIRIYKPAEAPEILRTEGKKKRRVHSNDFTRHQLDHEQGRRRFDFERRIYAHEAVKQVLVAAQHGKCCFCEKMVGCHGEIEHFRPKAAVQQKRGKPLMRPGYYWLAYEWTNLYLACGTCNSREKLNLFPLANPDARVRSHRQGAQIPHSGRRRIRMPLEASELIAYAEGGELPMTTD